MWSMLKRTPTADHWQNALDPILRHGKWTQQEDKLIVEHVAENGTGKWGKIAQLTRRSPRRSHSALELLDMGMLIPWLYLCARVRLDKSDALVQRSIPFALRPSAELRSPTPCGPPWVVWRNELGRKISSILGVLRQICTRHNVCARRNSKWGLWSSLDTCMWLAR